MEIKDIKVGDVITFDYESKSKSKPKNYDNPVKVRLTESVQREYIVGINDAPEECEEQFAERKAELAPYFEAIEVRDELIAVRKASDKKRTKTAAEKVADVKVAELKAEYFPKKEKVDYYERERSAVDLFFRNYSLDGITLKEDGKVTAILANKSVTVNGKIAYRFITFNEVTVEQTAIDLLDEDEQHFLDIV